MFLKLIIVFYLSKVLFTQYIDTITSTFAFRAGNVIISNGNGIYTVIYNIAFNNNLNVFMPALGISTLEFQNISINKQYIFDFDVKQYDPEDRNSFKIQVTLSSGILNSKIRYFVATMNQTHLFFLSLRDNQKQKISDESSQSGPTQTYTQNLIPKYAGINCSDINILQVFKRLDCVIQKTWNNLINLLTGSSDMSKAIFEGDTSTDQYTQLKIIVLIKVFRAKFSQTGGWLFEAYSDSNRITNLKLNITFSNSLSNLKYNFSIIIFNISSSTTENYQLQYYEVSFDNSFQSVTLDSSDFESFIYYLTAVRVLNIKNSSKFSFQLQTSTQFLYKWNSKNTYYKYKFAILGFFHKQCLDSQYPLLMMNTQKCYTSCPNQYYSNTTQCLKCQIQYPCLSCGVTSVNCIQCDPISKTILKDGQCVPCQLNQYFNQTVLNCITCPTGCESCINDSYCTSCYESMKMILIQHLCTTCALKSYFQQLSLSCQQCPINCTICQNLTSCSQCDNLNAFYLIADFCPKCNYSGYYFDYSSNICNICQSGCFNCTSLFQCTLCDQSLQLVLNNGKCQSCQIGFYYSSGYCLACLIQCYSCKSISMCTQCILDYSLRSGLCLNCSDQSNIDFCPIQNIICKNNNTYKTKANKCEHVYYLNVNIESDINNFTLCCSFNLTKKEQFDSIIKDYHIHLFQKKKKLHTLLIIFYKEQDSFQLCLTHNFQNSHTKSSLTLKFINNTLTDRIINPQYQTTITAPFIIDTQKDMYQTLRQIIQFVKSNSGTTMVAMIATSSLSLFIGFIEFAQITSLYVFINVPIPTSLKRLLSTIIDAQGCPLLPFQIPTLIQQQQFHVQGQQKYEEYQIDLYFIRSNLGSLIETLIYISIYFFLFTLLRCIKSKNIVFKFLKIRIVDRFYSNCVTSLQAIIIIIVFSASATITSFNFKSLKHMANYFSGTLFIFICLGGIFINMIILIIYKKQYEIDTEDVYPGIQRNRNGAQMYTMLRIFTLLVISICIPLLHLFYLIGIATIFLSLQLYIIFNRNLFKYKIQKYLRILHTVCFLLFNWNFLGLYILQYYPNINIEISSKIGLATIILLLIIYVLDLLQVIIDIVDIIYEKLVYLCNKFKKKKANIYNQQYIPGQVETVQEFRPNTITHYQRRKGTFSLFSQNKQILDKHKQKQTKLKNKNNYYLQSLPTPKKHKNRDLKISQLSKQISHKNIIQKSQNSTPMTKTQSKRRIGLFDVSFTHHV